MNFSGSSALSDSLKTAPSGLSLPSASGAPLTASVLSSPLVWGKASEIAFIDATVTDYQTLVAGIAPGTEVHVLDSSQDAVTQITNTLLGRSNVSSLHIFSHGEAGGLDFGSGKLNLSDLPEYATQLQSWGKALTNDADILLYGCDVDQGELGKAFVSILSQLTGADVAASNDLTGSTAKGGDWILEVNTGSIEAELALTQAARDAYADILPFTAATTVAVESVPRSVAIGDSNRDGKADIATANDGNNTVSVLLNTPPNAAPAVTLPGTAVTYTENATPSLLDASATVTDDSPNFNTGTLTVGFSAGGAVRDRLLIIPNGTVTLDGRRVLVSGTEIGTYRGGIGTNSLVVTLNTSATPTTTQALVRAIGFSSVSDALPFTATNRTVSVTLTDEAGNTSTATTKTISVTGSEDAAIVGSTQLLYDGSLNTPPQAQGWVFPSALGGTVAAANGTTNFTTTGNYAIRNGFTRNVASGLDAAAGYTLSFTAQVVSSTTNGTADKDGDSNVDRAGFNLIVVSSDATKAIELSFLTNEIFAQNDGTSQVDPSQQAVSGTPSTYTNTLFTRGEAATFSTKSLVNYDLTVVGNLYTLSANGTAILSGKLRNYTAFSGTPDPYEVPNQIFLGDDTTSANGEINLSRVALTTNSIANQTINEDIAGTVAIGLFDPDGTPPTVSSATLGNTNLLPNPAITGSGTSQTLNLTPAANQFGTATVTLNYNDGTASTRAFNVVVNSVNDAPTVTAPGAISTTENVATPLTGIAFADVDVGSGSMIATFTVGAGTLATTSGSGVTICGTATNLTLIGTVTAINSFIAGNSLTYTTALNATTTQTLGVSINDNGNTGAGGALTSGVTNVNLNVTPVNNAPSFTKGTDQTIMANSGAQTISNWATGFNPGPANESGQTVQAYVVTVDTNPGIFAVAPAIDTLGKLTYTPANTIATATTATISVRVRDNGGTANGGIDTSAVQTFAITVTPQPTISIGNVNQAEGNSGTTAFTFTVSLSNASAQTVAVNYTTADGTATVADGDYVAANSSLIFAPGETSKTITINVKGDPKRELDETFSVGLLNPTNATLAANPNSGIGTILNDDRVNLLWRSDPTPGSSGTGQNAIWQLNSFTLQSGRFIAPVADLNWQIVSTADFNNDSTADILWRNKASGQNAIWQMKNDFTLQSGRFITPVADSNWQIVSTADFNNDGIADIVWRNQATGQNAIWQMNSTDVQTGYFITPVADLNWQIAGIADFNGDGSPDLLWRNPKTGKVGIWQMNGFTDSQSYLLPDVSSDWAVKPLQAPKALATILQT